MKDNDELGRYIQELFHGEFWPSNCDPVVPVLIGTPHRRMVARLLGATYRNQIHTGLQLQYRIAFMNRSSREGYTVNCGTALTVGSRKMNTLRKYIYQVKVIPAIGREGP
jgi:hypothetical protein